MTETAPHIMELKGAGILSECEPVVYHTQFHRYSQTPGSGTLLWVKDSVAAETKDHTAVVLSGIPYDMIGRLIPDYNEASKKGAHIGNFGLYLHKSPQQLLQELGGKCVTEKIPRNGSLKTDTIINLIQERFHAISLEDTNVNLQSRKASSLGTKVSRYERGKNFVYRTLEQAELLKSIFLSQAFGNNQKILLMVKVKKGCDTEISVVNDANMIDDFYTIPGYKFFFADQGKTLSEFLPEKVGLREIII